jgi:hypothetical protein
MSCFVVGNETIDRIVPMIAPDRLQEHQSGTALDEIGKALIRMNERACDCRYGDSIKESAADTYRYHRTTVSAMQRFKAMQCFLHQCSEGTVDQDGLYLLCEKANNRLASSIICGMTEYESAQWG